MCGIFFYCGAPCDVQDLRLHFDRIHHRGPDDSQFIVFMPSADTMLAFGFHRLAINGTDPCSNQPFVDASTVTMCNGEIWNHLQLAMDCHATLTSGSDCEVLPVLHRHFQRTTSRYNHEDNLVELCKAIDGVFGLVLYDRRTHRVHLARDRIGIRSLYYAIEDGPTGSNVWCASELKAIPSAFADARPFPPGHCMSFDARRRQALTPTPYWSIRSARTMHVWLPPTCALPALSTNATYLDACAQLKNALRAAVEKRLMSNRPIGCVLSGGLDSTVVTTLVCQLLGSRGGQEGPGRRTPVVRTYTIGLEGAEDFRWARQAAAHLGTEHREFVVSEREFLDAIPDVIAQIESYDVTTVRASVGNWLLAKKIAECGHDTVLFCGDVADELLGGYRGFGMATSAHVFDDANVTMLENIHRFDVLRCEKSFAGHGLEARVPFADPAVVELAMSFPPEYKMWGRTTGRMEKDMLRRAFKMDLPPDLVWRRKEAFSDGVSSKQRSWYEIIREEMVQAGEGHVSKAVSRTHAPPYDLESNHYRELFEGLYGSVRCIPYLWTHPFSNQREPSARALANYAKDARAVGEVGEEDEDEKVLKTP